MCGTCGDDRCFASSATCHKCGTPRGNPPGPPAAAKAAKQPAPTAVPMEVHEAVEETTLADQVLELESKIKFREGGKGGWIKPLFEGAEAELKALKGLQKKARLLPARLKAASDGLAKFAAARAAGNAKVDELRIQVAKAEEELAEVVAKEAERLYDHDRPSGRLRGTLAGQLGG